MDDGWFSGRNDDTSSLGDWEPDPKKLPGGIASLSKKIKALGVDFGLWVEPEMISENSRLYQEHPDWAMTIPGHPHSEGRNQRLLDLCNPKVQQYVIDSMTKVFSSGDIGYVKWDMNRNFSDIYSPYLPAAKQGETAQLTEDESTGTTEQQTEETAGDADGTRAVQDQADDVENSLEQVPEMEAACEEEAAGNPEADAETAQNTPEESDGNTERQDAQAVNGTAADQNGETGSGETAANEETSAASGTVDSAENQETAVETAGAAQDLMFSEATIMELPVTGTVLIPYNMENTVYFPTLDLYQCNPGVVFSAAEGTPVLAAADGEVVSVENDARTGLTVTMNLGNGYEAIYGQLTDVSLEAGQKVQKAARIGAVAAPTKYYVKEGSNLFFEMKKDGKAIDPMVYLPAISE